MNCVAQTAVKFTGRYGPSPCLRVLLVQSCNSSTLSHKPVYTSIYLRSSLVQHVVRSKHSSYWTAFTQVHVVPSTNALFPSNRRRHSSNHAHRVEVGGSDGGERSNNSADAKEKDENEKEMERITVYGMGINVGLSVIKGACGVAGNSAAMIADAAHSLTDLVSDVVTLWTVRYARRPADTDHPYGHGKYESVGALCVSGLLVITGLGIGYQSVETIMPFFGALSTADMMVPLPIALGGAVVSLVAKEALFHATLRVGKRQNSQVVIANAYHHRSDALSSLVALAGIGGAMLGYPWLDPFAGLVVSGMIIHTGYEVGASSIHSLTDRVDEDIIKEYKEIIEKVHQFAALPRVRARRMGPSTLVDVVLWVDGRTSVSAATYIGERVQMALRSKHTDITEVLVHIKPYFDLDRNDIKMLTEKVSASVGHVCRPAHDKEYLRKENENRDR